MAEMRLYDARLSGNGHKVRLLLGMLDLPYRRVMIDLPSKQQKLPDHMARNPRGQVPVLEDGTVTVWDSQAILAYLARAYGGETWLPTTPTGLAEVMQWLAVSENEVLFGLARARAIMIFGREGDLEFAQTLGRQALDLLDGQLSSQNWLAADHPTIADIACYPYVATAPDGQISVDGHKNVVAWMQRVEAMPGYVDLMPDQ